MKLWKIRIHFVFKEIFHYAFITYLILLMAEVIKQGLVSSFFNLNILLGLVFFSGSIMVFTKNDKLDDALETEKLHKISTSDVEYIIVLATGGALLIYIKTKYMGILSIVLAMFTGLIVVLLSLLVFLYKE